MTYAQDEASREDSAPVEVYEFIAAGIGGGTYRYNSSEEDIVFDNGTGSATYTAIPIKRTMIAPDSSGAGPTLLVETPIDTAMALTEIFQLGFQGMSLTIWRVQRSTGFFAAIWSGSVLAWNVKDRMLSMRVPNKYVERMQEQVPRLQYQPYCNNVLYDSVCAKSRQHYTEPSFLNAVSGLSDDGKTITLTTLGVSGAYESTNWLTGGELVHDATGQRRMITSHDNLVLKILRPFGGTVSNSDAVTAYAGCNHTLDHCHNKFRNQDQFNGMAFIRSQSIVTAAGDN